MRIITKEKGQDGMPFITTILKALTGRSGTAAARQSDSAPRVKQGEEFPDLRALTIPKARPSRPELVARWEVEGLFPDATGRLRPHLRARWQVQEPGTPAWEDARAPRVAAVPLTDTRATGDKRAS
jgi:hypothetical protein